MVERTFTRGELVAAHVQWEKDLRADRSAFRSPEEIAAMTPEDLAEESVAAIEAYIDGAATTARGAD